MLVLLPSIEPIQPGFVTGLHNGFINNLTASEGFPLTERLQGGRFVGARFRIPDGLACNHV